MNAAKFNDASRGRLSSLKAAVLCSLVYMACAAQQAWAVPVVTESGLNAGSYTITSDGQVTLTITGGDGGNATNNSATAGGSGASATGVFDVVAGQVVYWVVGEAGINGGSAGGGGSTGVYIDNTLVLVAGAGGGGDNSAGQSGLGGNAGTSGLAGTGTQPGSAGVGGAGGGAGGGNDSGGGGGINSAGGDGQPGNGGGQADGTVPLSIASGGNASGYTGTQGNGGAGFSGGGAADPADFAGGGGGYSGGGGAGAVGRAGGGGSFHNTAAPGWVSSSTSSGTAGAGTNSDGTLTLDFECPANHILNRAVVSGSVEDPAAENNTSIACTEVVSSDFGDAPASYNDAQHVIVAGAPYIGVLFGDAEGGTQSNAAATGDNINNIDDEDGVTFSSPAGGGDDIRATITVTNPLGGPVTLCGWMDVNVNGDFNDAGEMLCNTATNPSTTFSWLVSATTTQDYYTRFRVCTVAADCNVPASVASDGEVEDYRITYSPTAVTIGSVNLETTGATEFLTNLGVEQAGAAALLALLEPWDPVAAANLAGAEREEVLYELRRFLDPDGDGQVAVLAWDTLEERGTIGFYVDRQHDGSAWVRINNRMLPGLITAPMGGEYRLADPGARSGEIYQYRLIEQEARGSTRTYGPFTVEMQ